MHYFGAGSHAQDLVGDIYPLGEQALGMSDYFREHHREEGGVVADVILYHQDYLDARLENVRYYIHPILHILDDSQKDASISLPQDETLQISDVVACGEVRQLSRVISENDYR